MGNIITCSVVSKVGNQTCEYWDKDEVWLLYYWYAKIITLHMTVVCHNLGQSQKTRKTFCECIANEGCSWWMNNKAALVYTCLKRLINSKFLEERDSSLASCRSRCTGPSRTSSQPVYSNLLMLSFNTIFLDKIGDTVRCISPIAKASLERKPRKH